MSRPYYSEFGFDLSLLEDPDNSVIVLGYAAVLPLNVQEINGPLPAGSILYAPHPLHRGAFSVLTISRRNSDVIIYAVREDGTRFPIND